MKSSKCYPENLEISERSAKCSAHSMVNHTLSGIRNISNAECLDGSETTNKKTYRNNWKILSEMDGASIQSIYKVKGLMTQILQLELKMSNPCFKLQLLH